MDIANTRQSTLLFFFFIRQLCRAAAYILFSFKSIGEDKIPIDGACVLASNHVSFVDWLLISSVSPRPIRFVLYAKYYFGPLKWFFDMVQVVPICSKEENETIYREAFDKISEHLEKNRLVCIFPEGKITTNGQMHTFKRGIEKITRRNKAPVIPARLSYSLWGHWSTRSLNKFSFWLRPNVTLVVSDVIDSDKITASSLEEAIRNIKE